MTAPLSGIRVLELARILAGPWCGQLLADLGCDVVKVERPGTGDDTRQWGPPFIEGVEDESIGAAYFHSTNRGKRSVVADFDTVDGQNLIRKLAVNADVVIENFKVGGLAKYGLDATSLRALNPRLIYCSITGFGQEGPYAPRAGYDFLVQGMGGAMSITGQPDGPPTKAGIAIADIFTGLYAANAIQAALIRREKTGVGATIDCALLDAQVAVLGYQAMNYLAGGPVPSRLGNAHPNIVPYDVFPVSDGHIIIATGNDGQFRKLVAILGAPGLADDPLFATMKDRTKHREDLTARLHALTTTFARTELLTLLEAAAVPAGPINAIDDVFRDPQVVARGLRVDMPAPHARSGLMPTIRPPMLVDGDPLIAQIASPALGQHQDSVLRDPNWGAIVPAGETDERS